MSGEVLLTQRGELVQELVLVARDRFFDMITQIYNKTKKKSPKKEYLLRNFQDELEEIPEWTPDDVFAESNPSFKEVKRDVTGLLTTIHDLNNQLFPQSPVHSVDNRTHDTEQDHFQRFVKMAMIHIAREFWKMPYLMHSFHDKNDFMIKTEIDKIIVQAIKTTIRRQSTLTIIYESDRSTGMPMPKAPETYNIDPPVAPAPASLPTERVAEQHPVEQQTPETYNIDPPVAPAPASLPTERVAEHPVEQQTQQRIEQFTETPLPPPPPLPAQTPSAASWQDVVENIEAESDSDESSISTHSRSSMHSDAPDQKNETKPKDDTPEGIPAPHFPPKRATTEEDADQSEDVSEPEREEVVPKEETHEKKARQKDDVELDEESQMETKPFSKKEENTIPLDILKQVLEGVVSRKKEKRRIKKPKKIKKGKGEKRKKEKKEKDRPISGADLKKYEKFFDPLDNV